MLFGPTGLFGLKLEIMLEISFLLLGDKKTEVSPCMAAVQKKISQILDTRQFFPLLFTVR